MKKRGCTIRLAKTKASLFSYMQKAGFLTTRLIFSLCNMSICNFNFFLFSFEDKIMVLIVSVSGHCLRASYVILKPCVFYSLRKLVHAIYSNISWL